MSISALKLGWKFLSSGLSIKAMAREYARPHIDRYQDSFLAEVKKLVDDPNSVADEDLINALDRIMDNERDKLWDKI